MLGAPTFCLAVKEWGPRGGALGTLGLLQAQGESLLGSGALGTSDLRRIFTKRWGAKRPQVFQAMLL